MEIMSKLETVITFLFGVLCTLVIMYVSSFITLHKYVSTQTTSPCYIQKDGITYDGSCRAIFILRDIPNGYYITSLDRIKD